MSTAAKLYQIAHDAFNAGDYGAVIKYANESLEHEYTLQAFKYFCLGNLKIGNFEALRDLIDVIDETDHDFKILKFDYQLHIGCYDAAAEIAKKHYVEFGFDSVSSYFCSAFKGYDKSEDKSYARWAQEKLFGPGEATYWSVVSGQSAQGQSPRIIHHRQRNKIFVDLTATIDHLKQTRAPTGIQRSCLALTLALHDEKNSSYDVQPIYLSRYTSKFIQFPVDLIKGILEMSGSAELSILNSLESWNEISHVIHGKDNYLAEATFSSDDIVICPDVIWGPYFRNLWLFKNSTDAKLLCVVHDMIVVKDRKENAAAKYNDAFQEAVDFALGNADLILVPSNATRVDVLRYAKHKRLRCSLSTIGWGVGDLVGFDRSDRGELPARLLNGQRFFLSVGTLSARKNFLRTAEAFLAARRDLPDDLLLVICGAVDQTLPEYRELQSIQKASEGKVLHLGKVSDLTLLELYKKCCALLLLSTDEGWGLPVSEAMAFRRPLLLSDCGSLPEVAGSVAQYADPYSVDDISSKMKLIFSPGEEQRLQKEYGRLPDRGWSTVSKSIFDALEVITE